MSTQQEREITIYATRGSQMKKITTSATTWGELKPLVRREGFDLGSVLAAENINKADLVSDAALLPAVPFRLYLRPDKPKSGSRELTRKECFETIKQHLVKFPEDKNNFIIDGKNITQLSTTVVRRLVEASCNIEEEVVEDELPEWFNETEEPEEKEEKQLETASTETEETPQFKYTPVVLEENLSSLEHINTLLPILETLKETEARRKAIKNLKKLIEETEVNLGLKEETEEDAIQRELKEMGY